MPHSEVPTSLEPQVSLLSSIQEKVDNDGEDSPLLAYLDEQGINIADDVAIGVTVMSNYAIYATNKKISEDFREQRDNLMLPIIRNMTGTMQFLKGFYEPNYKPVGDWGITSTDGGKLTVPTTEAEWQTLIEAINTKNSSYESPAISPLAPYLTRNSIVLADVLTNLASAIVKNDSMASYKTISEDAHELLRTDWTTPLAHIKLIVAFLMKLYKGNTKKLGYYGIVAVASARVVKTRNLSLSITQSKLGKQAKIGSVLVNLGAGSLNVYKGKTLTGTPIALAAGGKLLIVKGMSKFSVENPSAVIKGKLQIIPPAIVAKQP